MKKKGNKEKYVPLVPKKEVDYSKKFHHTSNKIYLGFYSRMAFSVIIFFIVLTFSLITIRESFYIININKIIVKENSDIDYKVYLTKNDTYDNNYLEKDMSYITSIIDYIETNLKYSFKVNQESYYNFKYQILGDLIIEDKDAKDKIYYKNTFKLSDEIEENIENEKQYGIDKTIQLDYWYYNGLANKFKDNYGVNTNSYLKVYIKIDAETDKTNYYSFKTKKEPNIIIPLAENSIKININNIDSKQKVGEKPEIYLRSLPLLLLGLVLLLVSILIITQVFLNIIHLRPKKSLYDKTIDKILKEYDDIIVNTTTPPERDEKTIVQVKEFKELLDAYNNLKEPIKYHIINEHNKSEFYIVHNDELYLLTMKSVDLENK